MIYTKKAFSGNINCTEESFKIFGPVRPRDNVVYKSTAKILQKLNPHEYFETEE